MTNDVLFEQQGQLGLITLNRPEALNALNLPMVRAIAAQLKTWEKDTAVSCVLITGAGDRAFCAGGDVRAVWDAGKAKKAGTGNGQLCHDFFREEYNLNYQIATYPKPYIAFLDGITMGGGVGLSVHGKIRLATDKTLFAMPECAIGFFPDVGGTYVLPRLKGRIGMYLALTGARLKGVDVVKAGIATHYTPSLTRDALISALAETGEIPGDAAMNITNAFVYPEEAMAKENLTDVLAALGDAVRGLCPLSLDVTWRALQIGARLSLASALEMEFRLSQAFMAGDTFYEGIRAQLVDKDKNPQWPPYKEEDVIHMFGETA